MIQNTPKKGLLSGTYKITPKDVQLNLSEQVKNLEISGKLLPTDTISYLIISTHGGTRTPLFFSSSQTELKNLGSFSESSVSKEIQNIFDPIKNRFSKNLSIILDSCSTLCGPKKKAANRAKALLDYFNAPNGTLIGAVTPVNPEALTFLNESQAQNSIGVLGIFSKMATPLTVPLSTAVFLIAQSQGVDFSTSLTYSATVFASLHLALIGVNLFNIDILFPLARNLGLLNKSKILVFKSGQMLKEVSLRTNLKTFLNFNPTGAACRGLFK